MTEFILKCIPCLSRVKTLLKVASQNIRKLANEKPQPPKSDIKSLPPPVNSPHLSLGKVIPKAITEKALSLVPTSLVSASDGTWRRYSLDDHYTM